MTPTQAKIRSLLAYGNTPAEIVVALDQMKYATRHPVNVAELKLLLTATRFPRPNILTEMRATARSATGLLQVALGDALSTLDVRDILPTDDQTAGAVFAALVETIRGAGIIDQTEADQIFALGGGFQFTTITEADVLAEVNALADEADREALFQRITAAHNAAVALLDSGERDRAVIAAAMSAAMGP